MFAFLNNGSEATAAVYMPAERKKIADVENKVREIEDLIRHQNPDWPERMALWEKQLASRATWVVIRPEVDEDSTGGSKYIPEDDGSLLAQGYAPTKHTVELTVKTTIAPSGARFDSSCSTTRICRFPARDARSKEQRP